MSFGACTNAKMAGRRVTCQPSTLDLEVDASVGSLTLLVRQAAAFDVPVASRSRFVGVCAVNCW